jgi:hypothetical protein
MSPSVPAIAAPKLPAALMRRATTFSHIPLGALPGQPHVSGASSSGWNLEEDAPETELVDTPPTRTDSSKPPPRKVRKTTVSPLKKSTPTKTVKTVEQKKPEATQKTEEVDQKPQPKRKERVVSGRRGRPPPVKESVRDGRESVNVDDGDPFSAKRKEIERRRRKEEAKRGRIIGRRPGKWDDELFGPARMKQLIPENQFFRHEKIGDERIISERLRGQWGIPAYEFKKLEDEDYWSYGRRHARLGQGIRSLKVQVDGLRRDPRALESGGAAGSEFPPLCLSEDEQVEEEEEEEALLEEEMIEEEEPVKAPPKSKPPQEREPRREIQRFGRSGVGSFAIRKWGAPFERW